MHTPLLATTICSVANISSTTLLMISYAQLLYRMHVVILVLTSIWVLTLIVFLLFEISLSQSLIMYCMFPLLLLLECQDYNHNYNYNYKSLIRLEVVKTDSPNFYKLHTRFEVVNLRASTSHIYTLQWLKQTLRSSTSIIHAMRLNLPTSTGFISAVR